MLVDAVDSSQDLLISKIEGNLAMRGNIDRDLEDVCGTRTERGAEMEGKEKKA